MLSMAVNMAQTVPSVISEHYTTANGLPSNNVMCALRGSDGFLWLGTWYGLCRFDGGKFVTYNQPVKAASDNPPRKIESIAEDAQGTLWLKTVDWKLFTFNPRTLHFHAVDNELKQYAQNLQIIKIQRDDEGHVLLLTKDKTLLMAGTDKKGNINIQKLADAKGRIDRQTFQLREDIIQETKDYLVYVGRDYRIFTLRKGKTSLTEAMQKEEAQQQQETERLIQLVTEAGIDKYSQLYQDNDSLLWVTSNSKGLYYRWRTATDTALCTIWYRSCLSCHRGQPWTTVALDKRRRSDCCHTRQFAAYGLSADAPSQCERQSCQH